MRRYQVLFSKTAAKELRQIPRAEIKKLYAKTKELETIHVLQGVRN